MKGWQIALVVGCSALAATGVYFVQLRTATLRRVRKVILVR